MSTPQPQVVPLFATPFGIVSLPDAAALNPQLEILFAARATAEHRDPASRPGFAFRSRAELFEWTAQPVRSLARGIADGVIAVVRSLNEFSDEQFATFSVQSRAWFTIIQPDGYVPSAGYPNAAWCAVYCVAAPEFSKQRFDSGVLRLHETLRAPMFTDATNSAMRMPYLPGHSTWRPVPGQLVVFPAAVTHEVAMLRATGPLILVTALLRFFAPGQTGAPW